MSAQRADQMLAQRTHPLRSEARWRGDQMQRRTMLHPLVEHCHQSSVSQRTGNNEARQQRHRLPEALFSR